MGFLLQAISQMIVRVTGRWINGSMEFLLQAIDTPNHSGSEKRQGLSLGSRKCSFCFRRQREVGSVLSWEKVTEVPFWGRFMVTDTTLGTGVPQSHVTWSSAREVGILPSSSSYKALSVLCFCCPETMKPRRKNLEEG